MAQSTASRSILFPIGRGLKKQIKKSQAISMIVLAHKLVYNA